MSAAEHATFRLHWIESRVLVHEARRRGFDRKDGLIRDAVLGDTISALGSDVRDPAEGELRAYFAAHRDDYVLPDAVDLSIATFPAGVDMPPEDSVRARLVGGARPEAVGPSGQVGPRLSQMSIVDLRQLFGGSFAERVFSQEVDVWLGPIDSTLGRHFVRVDDRRPARSRPFEEVELLVRGDWITAEERRHLRPILDELRSRYRVRIEP